jgi:hypothetical protein
MVVYTSGRREPRKGTIVALCALLRWVGVPDGSPNATTWQLSMNG